MVGVGLSCGQLVVGGRRPPLLADRERVLLVTSPPPTADITYTRDWSNLMETNYIIIIILPCA